MARVKARTAWAFALAAAIPAALSLSCNGSNQDAPTPAGDAADPVDAASAGDAAEPMDGASAGDSSESAAQSNLLPDLSPEAQQGLDSATQLITVVTPAWNDSAAKLTLFSRNGDSWTVQAGPWDARVGSKGLSWGRGMTSPPAGATRIKVEGDKTAPAGLFRLGTVMGYDAQPPPGLKVPYRQATADTICVDDPTSTHYNSIVEATPSVTKDWSSYESMLRPDNLYSLLALIDHNGLIGDATPVQSGGSCIFMHLWSGPSSPTIGCTALDGSKLSEVLIALDSLDQIVLVQLPAAEYGDAEQYWHLPAAIR